MDDILDADVRIGHVHLKVSDLERALSFYRDILGFSVTATLPGAVFVSAGGYHHHIGLNTWESANGSRPARSDTGLYHVAILFPNRKSLAKAVKRLIEHNYPLTGASDYGVSEAIYLDDPDGNGIELYVDRPKDEWPVRDGKIVFTSQPLDIDALLSEAK